MKFVIALLAFVLVAADPCMEYAPDTFEAIFVTTQGNFTISVTRDWAVNSADRLWSAMHCGHYSSDDFFWVVPGKFVQFGLSGNVTEDSSWSNLTSDVVAKSNLQGTVSFYVPSGFNTGSTELIINLADNTEYDALGYAPFGQLATSQDLSVVKKFYSGYGTQPDEQTIKTEGNSYLDSNFPLLDKTLGVDAKVSCARGTTQCSYVDGDDFAVQCCSSGENCITGVGCRCLKGEPCFPQPTHMPRY